MLDKIRKQNRVAFAEIAAAVNHVAADPLYTHGDAVASTSTFIAYNVALKVCDTFNAGVENFYWQYMLAVVAEPLWGVQGHINALKHIENVLPTRYLWYAVRLVVRNAKSCRYYDELLALIKENTKWRRLFYSQYYIVRMMD